MIESVTWVTPRMPLARTASLGIGPTTTGHCAVPAVASILRVVRASPEGSAGVDALALRFFRGVSVLNGWSR